MATRITSWIVSPGCMEIGIWIEPWGKGTRYRKEWVSMNGSYASRWRWLDGAKDSGQKSHASEELQEILDNMVREHEILGLLCAKYGVEVNV